MSLKRTVLAAIDTKARRRYRLNFCRRFGVTSFSKLLKILDWHLGSHAIHPTKIYGRFSLVEQRKAFVLHKCTLIFCWNFKVEVLSSAFQRQQFTPACTWF